MKRKRENKYSKKVFLMMVILGAGGLRFVEMATPSLEYGRVFNHLGEENEKRGQWKKAFGNYKKAIGYDPLLVEAYNNIANVYRHNHDLDKAVEFAQKAINLDPQFHQAYHSLGLAYRAKGHYQLALKSLTHAYELYSHYPYVPYYMYDLGIAYHNLGDEVTARQWVHEIRLLKEDEIADQLEQAISQN